MTQNRNCDALAKTQRARKDATRERILAALRIMGREIQEQGSYPANGGRVTLAEVARRAGVSAVTLRNPHHHNTRDTVHDWLAQTKLLAPTTKPKARAAAREKIAWFEDALRTMNAEALRWRAELATLTEENQKLRSQIEHMKIAGDARVVGFKSRDTKDG